MCKRATPRTYSRVSAQLPVCTHTSVCAYFIDTPTHAHLCRSPSHTHVHTQSTPPHPNTRPTHAAPHPARAYAAHTPAHTLTSKLPPPGADTTRPKGRTHTHSPKKGSMGHKCLARGCRTDGLSCLSCLPAPACVCAAVSSPLPQVQEGAGRATSGRGQATAGPNQAFHTPSGPRLLCKAPTSSGWKPKAGFVHRLLGTAGAPLPPEARALHLPLA